MAVRAEVRPVREAAPNGHAPRIRLHSEILPPDLGPATPKALRISRRALAILVVGIVVVQLISAPIGHRLNYIARSGTDIYTLFQRYLSEPVPDVLVIGASPARTDIDEPVLKAQLSNVLGRTVTVEEMGFAGENAQFLDAVMYRVMERKPHPKLVVVTLVGADLNQSCELCTVSVNGGLWNITDLTDPGFLQLAVRQSPSPGWLVAGWVLPIFAYYSSIIGLQCVAVDWARTASKTFAGKVPIQLQNPTSCESLVAYKWGKQATMDNSDYLGSLQTYRLSMANYNVSPQIESSFVDLVHRAQAGGSRVLFMEPPLQAGLRNAFPTDITASDAAVRSFAATLGVNVVDLTTAVPDEPNLWVDAIHLDRAGADYFANTLAPQLAPALSS
jgi:hypothetical protein